MTFVSVIVLIHPLRSPVDLYWGRLPGCPGAAFLRSNPDGKADTPLSTPYNSSFLLDKRQICPTFARRTKNGRGVYQKSSRSFGGKMTCRQLTFNLEPVAFKSCSAFQA